MDSILDKMREDNEVRRRIRQAQAATSASLEELNKDMKPKEESLRILPDGKDMPKCSMVYDSPANSCFQAVLGIRKYEEEHGTGSFFNAMLENYANSRSDWELGQKLKIVPDEIPVPPFSSHDWNVKPNVETIKLDELVKIPKYNAYTELYRNLGPQFVVYGASVKEYYRIFRYYMENKSYIGKIILYASGNHYKGIFDTWHSKEKRELVRTVEGWKHPMGPILLTDDPSVISSYNHVYVGEVVETFVHSQDELQKVAGFLKDKVVAGIFQRSETALPESSVDLLYRDENSDFKYECVRDGSNKTYVKYLYSIEDLLPDHDIDWFDPSEMVEFDAMITRCTLFCYSATPKFSVGSYWTDEIDCENRRADWVFSPELNAVTKYDLAKGDSPAFFKSANNQAIEYGKGAWCTMWYEEGRWVIQNVDGRWKRVVNFSDENDCYTELTFLVWFTSKSDEIRVLGRIGDRKYCEGTTWYSSTLFGSSFAKRYGMKKFNFYPIVRSNIDYWKDFLIVPMFRPIAAPHEWSNVPDSVFTSLICRREYYVTDKAPAYLLRFNVQPSSDLAYQVHYNSKETPYVLYHAQTGDIVGYYEEGFPWGNVQARNYEVGVVTVDQVYDKIIRGPSKEPNKEEFIIYVDVKKCEAGNYLSAVSEKFISSYPRRVSFRDSITLRELSMKKNYDIYVNLYSFRARYVRCGRYQYYEATTEKVYKSHLYGKAHSDAWLNGIVATIRVNAIRKETLLDDGYHRIKRTAGHAFAAEEAEDKFRWLEVRSRVHVEADIAKREADAFALQILNGGYDTKEYGQTANQDEDDPMMALWNGTFAHPDNDDDDRQYWVHNPDVN